MSNINGAEEPPAGMRPGFCGAEGTVVPPTENSTRVFELKASAAPWFFTTTMIFAWLFIVLQKPVTLFGCPGATTGIRSAFGGALQLRIPIVRNEQTANSPAIV